MTGKDIEIALFETLVGRPMEELQAEYEKEFGKATRSKSKEKIAQAIATKRSLTPPPPMDSAAAHGALLRAKAAWDSVEKLNEERKSELADLREKLVSFRDAITTTIREENVTDESKVNRIEAHWRNLTRAEEKITATRVEYSKQIRDAQQQIRSVFSDIRQIPLPLGNGDGADDE